MGERNSEPCEATVLITGATAGIGYELAKLFSTQGYNLVLVARSAERLETVAEEMRTRGGNLVHPFACDLSDPGAPQVLFDHMAERKSRVDILVNNAGFGSNGPFAEADVGHQLGMMQVNINALTHLTRLFLPGMIERKSGRIMNLASVAAFVPGPMMAVYYASKAYVLSFSIAVSTELKHTGVTVTAVCPGPTRTEFHTRAGIADSPLFSGNTMTAEAVAKIAYRGTMKGKAIVVTGLKNKFLANLTRFVPRRMAANLTKTLNSRR